MLEGRRSRIAWHKLNRVLKVNQNLLLRKGGVLELSLEVIFLDVVKKGIDLLNA